MRERLDTSRLQMLLPRGEDVDELHALFGDPTTMTVADGPHSDRERTAAWVQHRIDAAADHGLVWYLMRLRETGALAGVCGLLIGRGTPTEPELGYMVDAPLRSAGLASEAARATLDEARRAGFRRLWATIRPDNAASRHIVEALGFAVRHETVDAKGTLLWYAVDL